MKTEILYNKIPLDGIGSEAIVFTYALNKLREIKSRQGNFSNRFSIAKTNNNKEVLGNLDSLTSTSSIPYRRAEVEIKANGISVFFGFAKVQESQTRYILQVFGGNADFFDLIRDTKLADFALTQYDHAYTAANVNSRRQNTSGVVYPNINYGLWSSGAKTDRPFTNFAPAIYVKSLLEDLADTQGYAVTGVRPEYVLPFARQELSQRVQISAKTNASQIRGVNSANDSRIWFQEITQNRPSYAGNTLSAPFYTVLGTPTPIPSGEFKVTIRIKYNRDLGDGAAVLTLNGLNNAGQFPKPEFLPASNTTFEAIYIVNNISTLTFSTSSPLEQKINIEEASIEIDGVNILTGANDFVLIDSTLPDLSPIDIFLEEAVQQNAIIRTDPDTREIEYIKLDDIVTNFADVYDWSDKIDLSEDPKIEYQTGDYGQRNWLRWEDAPEDDPFFIEQTDALNGNFLIDDSTLDSVREIWRSKFAASNIQRIFNFNEVALYIPRFESTSATDPTIDPKPRWARCIIDDRLSITITGQTAPATQAQLEFDNYQTLIDANYQGLIGLLNRYKFVEVLIRLNEADINQLDLTKLVYIKHFDSYFYIDEVEQYQANANRSTLVKLVKI